MGKTKFEKEFETFSKNQQNEILSLIKRLFIEELKTDEEIANLLSVPKTAIYAIRCKHGIKKSYNDIFKSNAKKNASKFINNELDLFLSIDMYNELPDKYKEKVINDIQILLNDNKHYLNDISKELKISKTLINYLIDNKKLVNNSEFNKILKYKRSLRTEEQKLQEYNNRSQALKNRTIEQKIESIKKMQNTNLKKYGCICNLQIKEVREKVNENNLKKYGTKNALQGYKAKQTKLEKYGDENYNNREKYKETYNNFSKEKLQKIKNKTQETCLKKYGVPHHMKNDKIKEKIQKSLIDKYNVSNPFQIHPYENNIISKQNLLFKDLLINTFNIVPELEFKLDNNYFDFKIGNLLIEINPTVSHNSSVAFAHLTKMCTDINCIKHKPLDKDYHYNKWALAKNNGYELVSIFDWYDINKIMSLIKSKLQLNDIKIGARQTSIKIIDKKVSKEFLDKNHILGYDRSSDIIYGLYYNDLLVSVMSFGKPRYSKQYEWELLRYANLSNYTIYGGASKLWKQFLKDYSPKSVITYTNNDFGNGFVYKKLGFTEVDVLKNNRVWNIPYKNIFIKHTSLIRQGADRLLKNKIDNYFLVGLDYDDFIKRGGKEEYKYEYSKLPKDTTWWPGNIDIVRHYNFVDVYSSGTTVYKYVCL